MNKDFPYAVVVSYSFCDDVTVFPCRSEEEAKALLKRLFEGELAEDEANGNDAAGRVSEDGWIAEITNFRRDGSVDKSRWSIGEVHDAPNA